MNQFTANNACIVFKDKIYLQSAFTEKRTFFCHGDLKTNLIYVGKLLLIFPDVLTCYIRRLTYFASPIRIRSTHAFYGHIFLNCTSQSSCTSLFNDKFFNWYIVYSHKSNEALDSTSPVPPSKGKFFVYYSQQITRLLHFFPQWSFQALLFIQYDLFSSNNFYTLVKNASRERKVLYFN